jgi:hypothetical protein
VTTDEAPEGDQLLEQLDRVEQTTGTKVNAATADAAYANGRNYAALEKRATDAIIPPQKAAIRKNVLQRIPARRFKYDPLNDRITCPCGKRLHRDRAGGRKSLETATVLTKRFQAPWFERMPTGRCCSRAEVVWNGFQLDGAT